MPKAVQKGLVPSLRFPEFRDAGPWEVKRLGEFCDINPPSEQLPPSFVYIDLESVEDGKLIQKNITSRDNAPSRAQRVLKRGDVIYQMVRPYQKNNLIFEPDDDQSYVASTGYAQMRAKGSNSFLYQLIHTEPFTNSVLSKCTGSNYPAISTSDLAEIYISVPSLSEQQKIADCLSSLDDLILADEKALEALKKHKKGLMQQLFPAPGETTPKLRFPEFRDAGPWEVKRLGDDDIAKFIRERIFSTDIPNGNYVSTVNILPDFGGLAAEPEKPLLDSAIAYRKGDILVSNIRPYLKKVWIADRSGGASNDVLVIRPGKKILGDYLGHLLMSDRFVSYVMKGAKGVKMPRGDLEQIQNFIVPVPKKPEEQQKIADCLSLVDDLIQSKSKLIDALKLHKKGLIQQLFVKGD